MRRRLVAAAALLLTLTACSQEAGPVPEGQREEAGPGALAVKLEAMVNDDCFRAPAEVFPPNCEKYVTQLANVPGTARKFTEGRPALDDAATALDSGIRSYRDGGCTADDQGTVCDTALRDIATAVRDLRKELSGLTTESAARAS